MYSEYSYNDGKECTLAVLSLKQNREVYWNEGSYAIGALIRTGTPRDKNTF